MIYQSRPKLKKKSWKESVSSYISWKNFINYAELKYFSQQEFWHLRQKHESLFFNQCINFGAYFCYKEMSVWDVNLNLPRVLYPHIGNQLTTALLNIKMDHFSICSGSNGLKLVNWSAEKCWSPSLTTKKI